MDSDEKQPFLSHLEELRKRLIVCAIGAGIGFVIAYFSSIKLYYNRWFHFSSFIIISNDKIRKVNQVPLLESCK